MGDVKQLISYREPDLRTENEKLKKDLKAAEAEIWQLKMTLDGPVEIVVSKSKLLAWQEKCPKCGHYSRANRAIVNGRAWPFTREDHARAECSTCGAEWLETVDSNLGPQRESCLNCSRSSPDRKFLPAKKSWWSGYSTERIVWTCYCGIVRYERPLDHKDSK